MIDIETFKARKTCAPFIEGPVAQMLSERMNADRSEIFQAYTYLYHRILTARNDENAGLIAVPQVFTWPVPDDYDFILQHLIVGWDNVGNEEYQASQVRVNLSQNAHNKNFMPLKVHVPTELITTPNARSNFDIPFRYAMPITHTFNASDQIEVSVIQTGPIDSEDGIHIVAHGLRVPKDFKVI